MAGLLLDHDVTAAYVGLMVVGCVAIAAMATALERRITDQVNGVTEPEVSPAAS